MLISLKYERYKGCKLIAFVMGRGSRETQNIGHWDIRNLIIVYYQLLSDTWRAFVAGHNGEKWNYGQSLISKIGAKYCCYYFVFAINPGKMVTMKSEFFSAGPCLTPAISYGGWWESLPRGK